MRKSQKIIEVKKQETARKAKPQLRKYSCNFKLSTANTVLVRRGTNKLVFTSIFRAIYARTSSQMNR